MRIKRTLALFTPVVCVGLCLSAIPVRADASGWRPIVVEAGESGSQVQADGIRMTLVDGVPYYIASWEGSDIARIYMSRRDEFQTIGTITGATGPEDALLLQGLCGDSTIDAVVTAANGVFLLYEALAGGAAQALPGPDASRSDLNWMYSIVTDVDDDGDLDIVSGAKGRRAQVGWFRNPERCESLPCGDPMEAADWEYFVMMDKNDNNIRTIMTMLPLDMDHDGDVDIFYTDRSTISYIANGGGDPTEHANWSRVKIHNSRDHYMFSHVVNFDGDPAGKLDIVSVTRNSNEVVWFRNNDNSGNSVADGGYTMFRSDLPARVGRHGKAARAGDMNNDGKLDIVLSFVDANRRFGIVALMSPADPNLARNQFTDDWPEFTPITGDSPPRSRPYSHGDGIKFDDILLFDIDRDGDLDVLSTEEVEGDGANIGLGVVAYQNPHFN